MISLANTKDGPPDNVPARRLVAAAAAPDDFDPARDTAIGPWCFAAQGDSVPGWESYDYPNPVVDADAAKQADDAVAALANRLLPELAKEMNTRHGVSYSTAYWHVLLMRWLLELLTQAYCRYGEAKAFLATNGDAPFTAALAPAEQTWIFETIAAFYTDGLRNVDFNAWLSGLALRALAPAAATLTDGPAARRRDRPTGDKKPVPRAGWLRALRGALSSERVRFSGDFAEVTGWDRLRSALAQGAIDVWLRVIPPKRTIRRPDPATVDTSAADRLDLGFVRMVRFIRPRALPRCFDEDFRLWHDVALTRTVRPGRLNVQVPAFMLDEARLFRLARAVESGEGLVFVQHGANYGMARAYSLGSEIEYRHHAFLTWGWRRHGDYAGNFVPLPAPQLSAWRARSSGNDGTLLFVGTFVHMVMARLISVGAPFNLTWIRRQKDAFIEGLAGTARDALRYRPYPETENGVPDWPYFSVRHPRLQPQQGNFHQALRRCRLLVLDHPGLTFQLAMATNVPAIGFWNPESWPRAPEAADLFGRLEKLGIVFDNGAAAAARVNELWDDVEGWWRRPDIQAARDDFCRHHARSSRWWWWPWMKTLAAL